SGLERVRFQDLGSKEVIDKGIEVLVREKKFCVYGNLLFAVLLVRERTQSACSKTVQKSVILRISTPDVNSEREFRKEVPMLILLNGHVDNINSTAIFDNWQGLTKVPTNDDAFSSEWHVCTTSEIAK